MSVKMKTFLIAAFLIEVLLAKPIDEDSSEFGSLTKSSKNTTNCRCGWRNRNGKRIIGGEISEVHEWPIVVALLKTETKDFVCGGTIVTKHHIVSAAHCFFENSMGPPLDTKKLGVVVGGHKISEVKDNDIIPIDQVKFPTKHKAETLFHDVAVIIVKNIKFSETVGPACILEESFNPVDKNLRQVGWGLTKKMREFRANGEQMKGSDVLKKTIVKGLPLDKCDYAWVHKDDPFQTCVYDNETAQCVGDSGSPVLWHDPDTNRYNLVGVPSFLVGDCGVAPAVLSDFAYFLPWVKTIIKDTFPKDELCHKI